MDIDMRYHFIGEIEKDTTIATDYFSTDNMIADRLTKTLTQAQMKIFIEQMGMQRE